MDKRSGNYIKILTIYKVSVMNRLGRKKKKFLKKIRIKEVLFKDYFYFPIKYFYFYQKLFKVYGDKFEKDIIEIWGLK
jgi:hypothetical protein